MQTLHHAMIVKDIDNIISEYGLPFFLECLAQWANAEKDRDGGTGDEPPTEAQRAVYKQLAASANAVKEAAEASAEF